MGTGVGEGKCWCKSQSPKAPEPGAPIAKGRRRWTTQLQERENSSSSAYAGPQQIG